ncbi:MAG: hypothetical protein ACK4P3_03195 [Fimbriimonadaceae bacterium]
MARSKLKLVGYSIGQGGLKTLISQFSKKGGGIITSDSGGLLRTARTYLDPDEDRCQIKTFQELVGWCQSMLFDKDLRVAGSEVQRATLLAACQASKDPEFAEASRWPEFTEVLGETFSLLRGYGVNEHNYAAPQVPSALRTKLASLFSIEANQLELLHQLKFYKQHEVLATFEDSSILRLPEEPILLIVAEEFRPSVIEWVRNLGSVGVNITVALEGSPTAPSAISRLWRSHLGEPEKGVQPVSKILLALEGDFAAESEVEVTLVSTPNVSEECDWAVRHFSQDPKSSAVFVTSAESYNPLMEAAARKHGVKLSAFRSQPLRTDPWVNLLCHLFEALAFRQPHLLIRFFASTFNQFSVEFAQTAIEMMRRPRGDILEQLSALEPVDFERDQWFLAVLDWCFDLRSTRQTYLEWVEEMRSIIEVVPWTDSLVEGDPLLGERTSRAQFRFVQALRTDAEVARLSSDQAIDFSAFVYKVRRLVETSTSTVPRKNSDHEVFSDSFSLPNVDHLMVVGATDGNFPSRAAESPLLGDSEMEELTHALQLSNPLPTSSFRSQINRDAVLRTLNSANRSIHLLYPRVQDDRQAAPALIIQRLKTAGIRVRSVDTRLQSFEPVQDGFATSFDRRMNELLQIPPKPLPLPVLQTDEGRRLRQSVTTKPVDYGAVLSAVECPFRSTMERLRVPVRWRPAVERIFSTIPAEAKLGEQPDRETARKVLTEAIDRVVENLRADLSDEVRFQAKVRALATIDEWVAVEFALRDRFVRSAVQRDLKLKGYAHFGEALEPVLVEASVDQWFEIEFPKGVEFGARIYDGRSIRSHPGSQNGEDFTELFKPYLRPVLAAMIKPEDPSQVRPRVIEYFTPGGKICFWRGRSPGGLPKSALVMDRDLTANEDLTKFVLEVLNDASEVLRSVSIEPRPSPKVCQFCSCAELCRSAPDLRDNPDTFGGPA